LCSNLPSKQGAETNPHRDACGRGGEKSKKKRERKGKRQPSRDQGTKEELNRLVQGHVGGGRHIHLKEKKKKKGMKRRKKDGYNK